MDKDVNGLASIQVSRRLSHYTTATDTWWLNFRVPDRKRESPSIFGMGTGVSHLVMTGRPEDLLLCIVLKRFGFHLVSENRR